jgi:hypothetical protein
MSPRRMKQKCRPGRYIIRASSAGTSHMGGDYLSYQSGVDVRQLSTSPQLSAWPIGVDDAVQPPQSLTQLRLPYRQDWSPIGRRNVCAKAP